MLVSSLPHLPHFLKADRLPISLERLRWRRGMLHATDARDLELALSLLHWPRLDPSQTDETIHRLYRHAMEHMLSADLRQFVDDSMGERSALAALRRKARKQGGPGAGGGGGVGAWERTIRSHWEREDLGLAARFPWLPQGRSLLEQGRALELEQLLAQSMWQRASKLAEPDPFRFEAVAAYAFKWDVLNRWLAQDAAKSAGRFSEMVDEVIHE
jgi:hypothetical protein